MNKFKVLLIAAVLASKSLFANSPDIISVPTSEDPIINAALQGNVGEVQALLTGGSYSITDTTKKRAIYKALNYAALKGYTEVVQIFVEEVLENWGVHVDEARYYSRGPNPLVEAAEGGHTTIVDYLLSKGAQINQLDYNYGDIHKKTPLCVAAKNGHMETVMFLVGRGAAIDYGPGGTPFCEAAQNKHMSIMEYLYENGADINEKGDAHGNTPLYVVAQKGDTDTVEYLLSLGADINRTAEYYKYTPCYAATENGHVNVVQALLKYNPMIHDENNPYGGQTSLHLAIEKGNIDLVAMFLEYDKEHGNLLINQKSNNPSCGYDCGTPLHYAVRKGNVDIIQLLLENGADINKRDDCRTPLQLAKQLFKTEIISILESKMPK